MIITPKVRGFVCTTAHPIGCKKNVEEQANYVLENGKIDGPKNVLIIGASTGYGLASRIVSAQGCGANTLGVFYEKEAKGKRTASPGWYNSAFFEEMAIEKGLYAKSINGDAFSNEIKDEVIETIKKDLGKVDLVIYSLAAPRRIDPETGEKYMSVLKPIGQPYTNKSIDIHNKTISMATIEPASDEEIANTSKVMGGEDWKLWIEALIKNDVLEKNAKTISYSYIGPEVTRPIYREGTIGRAKQHLESTAIELNQLLKPVDGEACVVIAKALVTQASAAIPIVPLYMAALYKVMKKKGTHEGCIEQIYRLFSTKLYNDQAENIYDEKKRIRIDEYEMDDNTQKDTFELFEQVDSDNMQEMIDIESYQEEFYKLFGFSRDDIDYEQDVDTEFKIPSFHE
jgi:enoyl-[acyl-carrier protein] reductase/trans-2-enoyl-CoA reductase (NAD+)